MTRNEYDELYDQLYYGHEVELVYSGDRYYLEQNNTTVCIYLFVNDIASKIDELTANNKEDLMEKVFSTKFLHGECINSVLSDVEIVAID